MYTNKPIRIHSKCLAILEMIQKCNNRIADYESRLTMGASTNDWMYQFMNDKKYLSNMLDTHRAMKERLVNYYHHTMENLFIHA